ncbi:MAG TPA: sulfatase [Opitutus sp.]|nr:sulfatase [Opitutus sp.]
MKLRSPIRTAIAFVFSSVLVAFARALSAAPARPNIVFIFSDDHAWQALSAYGDPRHLIETPNLDRIAKTGMRFDRCLVTNSLCGPSRAVVLTGKYSHLNGFRDNAEGARFDGSQVTFPKLLRAAGYQTAMIGKWHLGSDPTGFDFWQILHDQGVYYDPPMIRNGRQIQLSGYVTDLITDASIDWLEHRDRSRPFLLMCQHKATHREWEPAVRDLDADGDRVYPEPPTLFDDYSGRGPAEHNQDMEIAVQGNMGMNDRDLKLTPQRDGAEKHEGWAAYYDPRNAAFRAAHLSGRELIRWKYQRYLHDYLATVRSLDRNVGRLLDYLDAHGLTKNTIIVYASDQGFFLGEHGWFDKRWIFEESLRTPFLVSWPGVTRPGSVNRDIVSNLDFAETFLEAAGVAIPAEMQGRSLVPLLEGRRSADWRTSFYYHYYEYPYPHHVRPHYGVVTDRYKLVHFYGDGEDYEELFDLKTDPHELRSVYAEPHYAAVRKNLTHELARLRRDLRDPDPLPEAAAH